MGKFITVQGTTSQIVHVFAQSAGATDGRGYTGLSFSQAGFTMAYIRASQAGHSLVTKTGDSLNLGTYVSGAWLEVSSGTMPGVYEFHLPNAALTSSGNCPRVVFLATYASIAPISFEVVLDTANSIFTPVLAATTHAGVTIANVQTCATVTRVILCDKVSTAVRVILVDTATRVLLADTVSTVARVLLADTVSTVARVILVDTATLAINVNTATTIVNPVTISASQILIKRNKTLPGFTFLMTDTASHGPKTGLSVTGQFSLTGAAFAAMASVGAEMASGWYSIDIASAELNAPIIALRLTGADADDRCITIVTQT